mmetsp:Transcript_1637/g.3702  ORF Transcript_1637/g.3702 Transcript_1637/m.3702 type:complete len:282 (-) Transcript_1637:1041-1886(-)
MTAKLIARRRDHSTTICNIKRDCIWTTVAKFHVVLSVLVLITLQCANVLYSMQRLFVSVTVDENNPKGIAFEPDPVIIPKVKIVIPRKLIFLDTRYSTADKLPEHFYDNIMRTASHYREAWNESDAPMWYLGDKECREAINVTEPRLLPFYDREKRGQNLANVCRISALFLSGGYYFDTDMKSVKAVELEADTTFATPTEFGGNGLFNSFIASAPNHPVLGKALELMLGYYHGKVKDKSRMGTGTLKSHMGTGTLKKAFEAVPETDKGKTFLLDEINLLQD